VDGAGLQTYARVPPAATAQSSHTVCTSVALTCPYNLRRPAVLSADAVLLCTSVQVVGSGESDTRNDLHQLRCMHEVARLSNEQVS
jgi:hypothetical protein